uniref:Actin-related protein 2/3 complex subunit n=1 Tax=Davidia involucrata TaxID=16924 RepID=A0A5B7AXB9_DAVIN
MAAAIAVHQFAQCITCHAWSPDHSMIAFCPNNNEVHIYRLLEEKWERIHVLQKHDQIVSGIDWSIRSNRIVTVSHDRNSYVWNQEAAEWVPTLVILRLNRAALCVQWSPKENKFAVGSGAKTVCICYYEQENNWWVSKLIRKRHDSSVTSVAWHPNNILLATTSTDGKCRVFSTFIKGVDTRDSRTGPGSDSKFGEQIVQLDLSFCWAFGVKWSSSGNTLAYVGHNSMIYFVDEVGPSPSAQNVAFRDLPLRDILFVSERMVIGVGFDCNPMVFAADERGLWNFIRFLGQRKTSSSSAKYGSQFSEAFGKLYGQSKHGISNDTVEPSRPRGGIHENCINCIVPLKKTGDSRMTRFSTSGLDGKVVIWDLENQEDLSEYF